MSERIWSDQEIATLYRVWSEDTYRASWYLVNETAAASFARWVRTEGGSTHIEDYEAADIPLLREALERGGGG